MFCTFDFSSIEEKFSPPEKPSAYIWLERILILVPPELFVYEVLVFVFVVQISEGNIAATFAILCGLGAFARIVPGVKQVRWIGRCAWLVRTTGVIDSLVIPKRYNHVGCTAKEEDFVWLGDMTDFFILLIGWADHLLVGSVREDNVTAVVTDKDCACSEFKNVRWFGDDAVGNFAMDTRIPKGHLLVTQRT